jgi:hypothetical protein
LEIVDEIESSHLAAASEALASSPSSAAILETLKSDIAAECSKLRSFMAAAEVC